MGNGQRKTGRHQGQQRPDSSRVDTCHHFGRVTYQTKHHIVVTRKDESVDALISCMMPTTGPLNGGLPAPGEVHLTSAMVDELLRRIKVCQGRRKLFAGPLT